MLHSSKNKSNYDHRFHNRNDFYIIDNNEPVLDFINMNNTMSGVKSINTYDFSTLYTSIPHDQLKNNLELFVNKVFTFKDKQYIIPNLFTKKAYFSNCSTRGNNKVCFSKDDLLECLFYLIDNSYVVYQNIIYRQVIGVPMGTNCGPQLANIYLYVYEYSYIATLIDDNDIFNLSKLQYIFRYQDDLISFNDSGLFGDLLSVIYPSEMVVNCTNVSARKCNYLDLCISIYHGKFRVVKYDKKEDFSFNVISYPFLSGNIPSNLSYGIFTSQLVRFSKINSTYKGFKDDISKLVTKLVSQGFALAALRIKFVRFYYSRLNLWAKFGLDIYPDLIRLFG